MSDLVDFASLRSVLVTVQQTVQNALAQLDKKGENFSIALAEFDVEREKLRSEAIRLQNERCAAPCAVHAF